MSDDQQQPWSKKLPKGYQDILKSIDEFFQNTYTHLNEHPMFLAPIPVRVKEEKDIWKAEIELPGVKKSQIKLDIYRQTIRIQVIEDEQTIYTDEKNNITERHGHSQVRQRVINVPFLINEKEVKAVYSNGLLVITIPNRRKKIAIE
ncbi:Hsp20/alpha crystallin family protein [Bacillus suaedae]|uniref:Hsp20/alpha crystallin family protein n=1 Tax=Halalkalibacter suaedae TaxID=2822140 RepID=A0A940X0L0_9BACI|nr:Hsp20/alpha crystallin family protein [Bacillus suaedae]MBP3952926.1 Hsp20/alpha crystallin family protein [Bacillus suaedae]